MAFSLVKTGIVLGLLKAMSINDGSVQNNSRNFMQLAVCEAIVNRDASLLEKLDLYIHGGNDNKKLYYVGTVAQLESVQKENLLKTNFSVHAAEPKNSFFCNHPKRIALVVEGSLLLAKPQSKL